MNTNFNSKSFQQKLFESEQIDFEAAALQLFKFQYHHNAIYRKYCQLIGIQKESVTSLSTIPFLPISFFKSHHLKTTYFEAEETFNSSGTSSSQTSKHFVKDIQLYEKSFEQAFEHFYGKINHYRILALLPSYLERKGSSLVYMADYLIKKSGYTESGFFLNNLSELNSTLNKLAQTNQKVLLIGVSFGLLDFVESFESIENTKLIVMETGGMKGRRKELVRKELHELLKLGFKTQSIHSEYGMTELLSQAYSKGKGKFETPPWMRISIRKQDDPFSIADTGETGGINIIDLANIYSCAFIQTDDLGRLDSKNAFEVLGRFDAAEVRGCNLLIS